MHAREWIGPAATTYLLQVFYLWQGRCNKKQIQQQKISAQKKHIYSLILVAYRKGRLICLLQNLLENPRCRKMVRAFDWFVMPIANPDGYRYSRQVFPTGTNQRLSWCNVSRTILNWGHIAWYQSKAAFMIGELELEEEHKTCWC